MYPSTLLHQEIPCTWCIRETNAGILYVPINIIASGNALYMVGESVLYNALYKSGPSVAQWGLSRGYLLSGVGVGAICSAESESGLSAQWSQNRYQESECDSNHNNYHASNYFNVPRF